MTVQTTSNKMAPQIMGTSLTYNFNLRALTVDGDIETAQAAIKAIVVNSTTGAQTDLIFQDVGTDGYTVAINPTGIGGVVTVNSIRTSDDKITIYREYNLEQDSDYNDINSFPAETLENNLDKTMMIDQQQADDLKRSLKAPITAIGVDYTLPLAEANTVIGYNAAGTAIVNYATLPASAIDTSSFSDGDLAEWDAANMRLKGYSGSGVTPGTYTSADITVDAYGRVTVAADGSGGGGVVEFDELGTISSNFTLVANKISLGAITGALTLTLPTVTDLDNQVVCVFDFSTDNTGLTLPSGIIWSDKNGGKAPSSYSTLSGIRNVLVFKTIVVSSAIVWEVEYSTYGGIETAFTRPNLTANGTMGGTAFAVDAQYGTSTAYRAVDSDPTGTYHDNQTTTISWFEIYNPDALKATKFQFTNWSGSSNYIPATFSIYGSNDRSVYTFLANITNTTLTAGSSWDALIPSGTQDYYKYYKFNFATNSGGTGIIIGDLLPTATYIAV